MKLFEYKVLTQDVRGKGIFNMGGVLDATALHEDLNALGRQGWELVSSLATSMGHGNSRDVVLIFKRELTS